MTNPNIITDCNITGLVADADYAERLGAGVSEDTSYALSSLREVLGAEVADNGEHVNGVQSEERIEKAELAVEVAFIEPAPEPTGEQIEALRTEAATAGDDEMVALCEAALSGDDAARIECVDAIREAE
jgi:hypothetical protein